MWHKYSRKNGCLENLHRIVNIESTSLLEHLRYERLHTFGCFQIVDNVEFSCLVKDDAKEVAERQDTDTIDGELWIVVKWVLFLLPYVDYGKMDALYVCPGGKRLHFGRFTLSKYSSFTQFI